MDDTANGKFPTTTPLTMLPFHHHEVQLLSLAFTKDSFTRPMTTSQAGQTSCLVLLRKAQQQTNTPGKHKRISLILFQDLTCHFLTEAVRTHVERVSLGQKHPSS